MHNKICLIVAVLLAAICSTSTLGQTKAKFVSVDGGFSIDLPKDEFEGLEPVGNVGNGAGSFSWHTDAGLFTVSYVEGAFPIDQAPASLNALADAVAGGQKEMKSQVIGRRQFMFSGNPAVEIRIRRAGGSAINRFVMVGRRLFVLTADWSDGDGSEVIRVLDSFDLIERRSLVAE